VTERIEWISDAARMEALRGPWEALASAAGDPFARQAWYAAWWEAFGGPDVDLDVGALWRDETLAGVLPLVRRGRRAEAMVNDETPQYAAPAADREALAHLSAAASRRTHGELLARALRADGDELPALRRAARSTRRVQRVTGERTLPFVRTTGAFQDWRAETRPRWHVQIDRLWRKARREHELDVEPLRVPVDVDGELATGVEVEARSWKGERGTAIRDDPRNGVLYRELAHRFAALGELRLGRLRLGGRTVAFDFSIVCGGRVWLVKTGYDPAVRNLAPGLLLHYALIEACFGDPAIETLELLGDADDWKAKFATGSRELQTLASAPAVSSTAAGYGLRRLARPIRLAVRRARGESRPGAPAGAG
jgi:CelD/BcsL family acetyltransferase involved in cellulose biosynthesis